MSESVGSVDVGSVDAGSVDVGSVDFGSVDVGSVDVGSVDVGSFLAQQSVSPMGMISSWGVGVAASMRDGVDA